MNASPDTIGNARDVIGTVDGELRFQTDARRTEKIREKHRSRDRGSFSSTVAFATSTFADIAMVIAVVPLILFCGPSRTDTAYSIAIPTAILSAAPLFSWLLSSKLPGFPWAAAACAGRLILASILFASLGSTFADAGFITLCLSLSWGMRLQELVATRKDVERTTAEKLSAIAIPVCAILALLQFYTLLQPSLMPTAIALYVLALLFRAIELVPGRATADSIRWKAASQARPLPTLAYELVLSALAGLMLVTPVLLLLTDQSLLTLALRSDVTVSLTGFLSGSLLTLLARRIATAEQQPRLEHLHLVFTVFLGTLLFCRYSTLALVALFFTCGAAGAITVSINHCRRQKALSITILIITSLLAYLYLSPLMSSWLPIHVIRSLAAVCLLTSLVAAFTWARSRMAIFKLVAHLIPRKKRVRWFNDSPEPAKRLRPAIHE